MTMRIKTLCAPAALAAAFLMMTACGQAPTVYKTTPGSDMVWSMPHFPSSWTNHDNNAANETLTDGLIEIFNASMIPAIPTPIDPGIKVLKDGEKTLQSKVAPLLLSEQAEAANTQLTIVRDYYRTVFDRNSWDNQGAPIRASVDVQRYHLVDILGMRNNAAWFQPFKMFIFGAGGDMLGGFADAVDVVGHEFTHAVVGTSSQLAPGGQSGALNEHLADVFGNFIHHRVDPNAEPFLIGASVLRGKLAEKAAALRDMLHPEKSLDPQPAKMSDIPAELRDGCVATATNDNCGVHLLNGIPNRAAALIIQDLGWEVSEKLFFTVMTEKLSPESDFADYRTQVVNECNATLSANECSKVAAAFADVGL